MSQVMREERKAVGDFFLVEVLALSLLEYSDRHS